MISFSHKGDFSKTVNFLNKVSNGNYISSRLEKYAQKGVNALRMATPVDTGLTAASWGYKIEQDSDSVRIVWTNVNRKNGVLIAIILQYGHATGTGGYVQGRNYIEPAIEPIFDEIANSVWKEVTKR